MAAGVPIGMLAGVRSGWIDALISRCTGAMLTCPSPILAIARAALGPAA
jgi:peptide/nickel transport system permease protein